MPLPKFIALKSNLNSRYLRFKHEDDEESYGFLQFSGDNVLSPYVRFEVVTAEIDPELVHLRCSYNNKYFFWSEKFWITGTGNHQNEDESSPDCTLFKPSYVDVATNTVQFLLVHLNRFVCLWSAAGQKPDDVPPCFDFCLYARSDDPDYRHQYSDVFTFIDLESLFILPKYVAFKGDNGKYLKALRIEANSYLQFSSEDVTDPAVVNEVAHNPDGSIRIKSTCFGKFWRRISANWICADRDDSTNDNLDTLFWPIKVDDTTIALRNLGNDNYCGRHAAEDKTDCLSATAPSNSYLTKFKVEELVLEREIYDVKFHLRDARIYDQGVQTLCSTNSDGNYTQEPQTVNAKISYSKTLKSTWKSNVWVKSAGIKTTLKAEIPRIVGGTIEMVDEFEGEYKLGETRDWSVQVETEYKIVVQPMTRATVRLFGTGCSIDVPFSYSQRDKLVNGLYAIYEMNDGIYTGKNIENFNLEIQQEMLESK